MVNWDGFDAENPTSVDMTKAFAGAATCLVHIPAQSPPPFRKATIPDEGWFVDASKTLGPDFVHQPELGARIGDRLFLCEAGLPYREGAPEL